MAINWEIVRAEYISTTKSLQEIAEEFKLNLFYLKRKAGNESWYEAKQEYRQELRRKVSKKLLEKLEAESEMVMERSLARADTWRYLEANLAALAQTVRVIDSTTGLPEPLTSAEAGRRAKVLKDVAAGLEKCFAGERLEYGERTVIDGRDLSLGIIQDYMELQKLEKASTNVAVIAKIDAILEERKAEETQEVGQNKSLDNTFPAEDNGSTA